MQTIAQSLWKRYRSTRDPHTRSKLLERHLGLVHHVARQLAERLPNDIEVDDLVSAGTLGLIRALESFDPSRGLEFSTYATPRIRGAILDDLRDRDWVPRSVRSKARRIDKAISQLQAHFGRPPRAEEVAEVLEIDMPTYWRWKKEVDGASPIPFESSASSDLRDQPSLDETLGDPNVLGPDRVLGLDEDVGALYAAIGELPNKERTVLALYYYEDLNLRQIAEVLHLTESRISQIRSQALRRLRSALALVREERQS